MMRKIAVLLLVLMLLPVFYSGTGSSAGTRAAGNDIKSMVFYAHNASEAQYIFDYSTTHVVNTTLGDRLDSVGDQQRVRINWYLSPKLAGAFTVNGNITFTIYANTTGVSANANLNLEIYEVRYKSGTTTDETLIASGGPEGYTLTSTIDSYSVTAVNVHHTFNKSSSIRVYLEIQGGADSYFMAWYGDSTYDSRVVFDSVDYLRVADVYTLDYNNDRVSSFDPNAQQKVIKIRANLTDPFGGYDIRWAKLTVIAPDGSLVLDNASMNKIDGTPISYNNIYGKSISYNDLPVGTYKIIVYAMDNNGYYYYYHRQNYEYGPYGDEGTGYFSIGLPNTVDFTLVDAFGAPIPAAEIEMLYGGEITASGITDSQGYLSLGVYTGTYTVNVIWHGNVITGPSTVMVINGNENNTLTGNTLVVSSDMSVKIYGNVGNLNLHVVDADALDLENAAIYLIYPNGSAIISPIKTNSQGMASLERVAGGPYRISVVWKGAEVKSSELIAVFTRYQPSPTYDIDTNVYNIVLITYDSKGIPISMVTVALSSSDTGNTEGFGTSGTDGRIEMRVPGGAKIIEGYWHDVNVYSDEKTIDSSGTVELRCSIYYLEVSAVGNDGKKLSGVDITLEKSGSTIEYDRTGSSGNVTFRVAPGTYTIRGRLVTTYMMQEINEKKAKDVSVAGNTEETLSFDSYPPNPVTTPLALFSIVIILLIALYVGTLLYLRKKSTPSAPSEPVEELKKPEEP